jgi:hypothetical protein
MKDIRARSTLGVAELLTAKLAEEKEMFASNDHFHLHGGNGRQVRRILARFTSFLEEQCGLPVHLTEYVQRRGKSGYEVEHIWANHPEHHKDKFEHAADFQEYRNRIGGLLLLAEIEERSRLYQKLAETTWNPALLLRDE